MPAETARVFPETESWRQCIEILNEEVSNDILTALCASTTAKLLDDDSVPPPDHVTKDKIAIAAVQFIFQQLTYFVLSNADDVVAALSEEVTSSVGKETSQRLQKQKVDIVAQEWQSRGKLLVQQSRSVCINSVCSKEPHIEVSTHILMAAGGVQHQQQEYSNEVKLFTVQSKVTLPCSRGSPPVDVILSGPQTYDLFVQLDAIQNEIDQILGGH